MMNKSGESALGAVKAMELAKDAYAEVIHSNALDARTTCSNAS
jgi:hypothetical protein